MENTVKACISLPKDEFIEIERIAMETHKKRSAIIANALQFWLKTREKRSLILQYERGYKKYPESKRETEALEKTSAEVLGDLL